MSAQLPEGTKNFITTARQKYLNPAKFRSPTVYVGLGEDRPFYFEKSPSLVLSRLKHNFQYFYLNYIVIAMILFCLTLLISPTAVIGIGIIIVSWVVTLKATESGSVTIGTVTIPQKPILALLAAGSLFALTYILTNIFWYTLFSSFLCAGGHAFFRDATLHRDDEDKVDMTGDLGEDAQFLNNSSHSDALTDTV